DGIRDKLVTGVQTCALPISPRPTTIVTPASTGRPSPNPAPAPVAPTPAPATPAPATPPQPEPAPTRVLASDEPAAPAAPAPPVRSEERRVGKECRTWTSAGG